MNVIRITTIIFMLLCISSCTRDSRKNESSWSESSNGLSAKLVFFYTDSSTHAKVIHPKLFLRNDSHTPIKFFKCVYYAGSFSIKTSIGKKMEEPLCIRRSGPQGAQIVVISPSEVIEFDTYDYGYGLKPDNSIYAFNTNSLQLELKRGKYIVDYSLVVNKSEIKKILESFDWIKDDPNTVWTGQISIKNIEMYLE